MRKTRDCGSPCSSNTCQWENRKYKKFNVIRTKKNKLNERACGQLYNSFLGTFGDQTKQGVRALGGREEAGD